MVGFMNRTPFYMLLQLPSPRDGQVSLQEYMAFMISRETENVQSAQDVEAAFRALTSGDKPYITATELYTVRRGYRNKSLD